MSDTLSVRCRSAALALGAIVGASGAEQVGTASNLHDARDIERAYIAVSAGVALAGGGRAAQLTSARGRGLAVARLLG